MNRILLLVNGLLMAGVVALGIVLLRGGPGGMAGPWQGSPMGAAERAPDFALTAHDGRAVSPGDFRGRAVVLFFGFTHCPDVCPMTMASLARAMELLGSRSERVQVLFVSVDPQRDTPDRLGSYLGNFHPDFLGITGTEEEIRRVATAYGAFYQRRELEGEGQGEGHEGPGGHEGHGVQGEPGEAYLIDHSGRTFVVDPRGRLLLTFPPYMDGEGMAADLRRVLGGR